jgi:hypothetical protein
MNIKVNNSSLFSCNLCIKNYSSKSSLCNHNKKIHSINNNIIAQMSTVIAPISTIIAHNTHNYK